MPVKKKKTKKVKNNKKIRADMRAAVNQIPAMLAAQAEVRETHKPSEVTRDDYVEYEDFKTPPKTEKPETIYNEGAHNNKMVWLWSAVSIFTILVVVMWFLNTRLIVKKYTESSFNPLANSQTELELVKKTLQSSDLQNALSKVRVSSADIELSEVLKKEIPGILSNLTSSSSTITTTTELISTSTPTTINSTSTTTSTVFSTSTEVNSEEKPKTNFPVSASTSSTPSL